MESSETLCRVLSKGLMEELKFLNRRVAKALDGRAIVFMYLEQLTDTDNIDPIIDISGKGITQHLQNVLHTAPLTTSTAPVSHEQHRQ